MKYYCQFRRLEDGSVTVLQMGFLITLMIFGCIAIDMASLISARTQLQIAADAAAHAALTERWKTGDANAAKNEAVSIAEANMNPEVFGEVLAASGVFFGTYDQATQSFTVDDDSWSAVLVETSRLRGKSNSVSSFLLQFVGFFDWNLRTQSIFTAFATPCTRGGFYARGRIEIQSNNEFWNGFCLHSDSHVELNQNNFFEHENGVRVSMPASSNLVIPSSGFESNDGLAQALRRGGPYMLDVDGFIEDIVAGVQDSSSSHFRHFTRNDNIVDIDLALASGAEREASVVPTAAGGKGGRKYDGRGSGKASLDPTLLSIGRIHHVRCRNGTLEVAAGTYEEMVVITNCNFAFSNVVVIVDSTFITTSTDPDDSIKAPQGLQIGADDDCAEGGGAQLILMGGMKSAAKLKLYGGQIIIAGDLIFAAQGNGFGGASVIAGGEIDGTSNAIMGLCLTGMEDFFEPQPVFGLGG